MRNLIFVFIVAFAFSCSSDDDGSTTNPGECIYGTDVTLKNQSEVDAFVAKKYCTIEGDLFIGDVGQNVSSDITDLSGLLSLKEVTGQLGIWFNGELVNLHGLENLQKVKTLSIVQNNKLETLEHLQSLTEAAPYGVTGSLIYISMNRQLKSLKGLERLENVEKINIASNEKLLNLRGLEGLKKANNFVIQSCNAITALEGLNSIADVGQLELDNNSSLTTIQHLAGLKTISGFWALDNVNLTSLSGLEQITKMNYLTLRRNSKLSSLQALQHVIKIDFFELHASPLITSLQGLENITTLSGLTISSCPNLTSLSQLSGVTSFVGNVTADPMFLRGIGLYDLTITSLSGLQNITTFFGDFKILSNANLTDFCAINNIVTAATPFIADYNAYNPTVADILAGNCSQ